MKRILALTIAMLAMSAATMSQDLAPILPGQTEPVPEPLIFESDAGAVFYPSDGGKCLAPVLDYTQTGSLAEVRTHAHAQTRTVTVGFIDLAVQWPAAPGWEQFLGNVLIVTFGDAAAARNNNDCTSRFWVDWASVPDQFEMLGIVSSLPSSRSISVTYDPECGLVSDVKVLTWR